MIKNERNDINNFLQLLSESRWQQFWLNQSAWEVRRSMWQRKGPTTLTPSTTSELKRLDYHHHYEYAPQISSDGKWISTFVVVLLNFKRPLFDVMLSKILGLLIAHYCRYFILSNSPYLIISYHFAVGLCLKVSIAVVLDCLKVYKRIYSFRALSIIKQVHGSPKLGPPLCDQYRTSWKVYKKRWVKWNKYYELIVGKQNGDERKPVPPYITLTK